MNVKILFATWSVCVIRALGVKETRKSSHLSALYHLFSPQQPIQAAEVIGPGTHKQPEINTNSTSILTCTMFSSVNLFETF